MTTMTLLNKTTRKRRIPVSGQDRNLLTIEKRDPNFQYRWVNKVEDRIARFLEAGYEPVKMDEIGSVGDRKIDTSSGTSSVVERGVGGGKTAMLMKIPKEFWEEDQAAKQKQVDESEAMMKRDAKEGRYGKIEISRGTLGSSE